MTFSYSIQAPRIKRLLEILSAGNPHFSGVLAAAARSVRLLVSRHIERLGATRHRTASSPGAEPTGHYERAAADVTDSVQGRSAVVVIPIAGFSRAFHDVTIRPKDAKALTIPIAAEAYGTSVREMRSAGWTIFRPKKSKSLWGSREGVPGALPLYALVSSVRQPQDRTLLPGDEELGAAAEDGAQMYISAIARSA